MADHSPANTLMDRYAQAVYAVRHRANHPTAWSFNPVSTKLYTLPFAPPWAIITAANPRSRQLTPEANAARHTQLLHTLASTPWSLHDAINTTQDSNPDWTEHAVLIERIALADALALARRFDQTAFVHATDQSVALADTDSAATRVMPISPVPVPAIAQQLLADSRP